VGRDAHAELSPPTVTRAVWTIPARLGRSTDADRRSGEEPGGQHADIARSSRGPLLDTARAGGHFVRFNGRVFEAIEAARQHRQRRDLYHAALVVELDGEEYTIELAPSPDADEARRGVVGTGAVGSRHIGWLRMFRYEVRVWRGGTIADLSEAAGGPSRLTANRKVARRLLDLVAAVPRPVWGRDELDTGEMWNSNSMIAWLIATAGLSTEDVQPPWHGRAPGWHAGLDVARRDALTRG